jgi:transcription elongation factor GreA
VTSSELWLTQEAYDRLAAELADREGPMRDAIKTKIQVAREEGDLKENGGYHAAREEQGKSEARIRQLKQMLENAKIGTPPAAEGEVTIGLVVTVKFADGDTESFWLASREEAGHATMNVYSPTSPLGEAVLGKKIGETVSYKTPHGKDITVEIVAVEPYTG